MIPTVMSLALLGQVLLPNSDVPIADAKEDAGLIVVARVVDICPAVSGPSFSIALWTALKPSALLKGQIDEEGLNTHPLSMKAAGKERLPAVGEECIVFLGDASEGCGIIKVLPKTEENLSAIRAAKPVPRDRTQVGGLGVTQLGSFVSPPRPRGPMSSPPPPFQGTKVLPDPKATGAVREAQDGFAAALSRDDPDPEDRRAHFSWLDRNECYRRYGGRRLGWRGSIEAAEPLPAGGWRMKVTFRPWLYARLRMSFVFDTVEETYEFVDGRARLVGSNAAIMRPERQVFPAGL